MGNKQEVRQGLTSNSTELEERNHSDANELDSFTSPSGNGDPVHDASGNMTRMPLPLPLGFDLTGTYDAWNRLVKLSSGAGAFEYDGLHRRIKRAVGALTTAMFVLG